MNLSVLWVSEELKPWRKGWAWSPPPLSSHFLDPLTSCPSQGLRSVCLNRETGPGRCFPALLGKGCLSSWLGQPDRPCRLLSHMSSGSPQGVSFQVLNAWCVGISWPCGSGPLSLSSLPGGSGDRKGCTFGLSLDPSLGSAVSLLSRGV